MQKDVYDYKIDYEMSILGYYCNTDNYDLEQVSMNVFKYPYLDEGIFRNVLSNYKFYCKPIANWDNGSMVNFERIAKTVGQEIKGSSFESSTPSLLKSDDGIILNVRYVNYRIGDGGEYINKDNIITKNVLAKLKVDSEGKWTKESEVIMEYDVAHDNRYVGLEDVRLFSHNNGVFYSANRGLNDSRMVIETGEIDMVLGKTKDHTFLQMEGQHIIEKNWVYFQDGEQKKMIYSWYPLTIGAIEGSRFYKTHELETPAFFRHLRNSTNGIVIGDEIWFIGHIVSYEDRRYYYHMVMVLDRSTLRLKKYTKLFTFESEKVEYTLGFIHNEKTDELLIGYSTMDRTTKFINVPRSKFHEIMTYAYTF
jgi:hypothetical protein